MNAAVWLGAAVFFTLGAVPAVVSPAMKELLGPSNYPYFSVAIAQLVSGRFFHLYLACSIVALLHLMAEWLYFGNYPRRFGLALVLGLCLGGLVQVYALQPHLKALHRAQYTQPAQRQAAGRAYRIWHGMSTTLDVVLIGGLVLYLWRRANPPDLTRFVSTTKFRS